MLDYEIIDGSNLKGIINVYWDNISEAIKKSLIISNSGYKYKVLINDDIEQKYELTFTVNSIDDLYDIVSKYISDDKLIFEEIDNIKSYNKIKSIKKGQVIKIYIPIVLFKNFNLTRDNIDKNSLINSKIYFINEASKSDNNEEVKAKLDKIVNDFNNIIKSSEYAFYDDIEKEKLAKKALNMLDELIKIIESTTNFRYGKNFSVPIKVK